MLQTLETEEYQQICLKSWVFYNPLASRSQNLPSEASSVEAVDAVRICCTSDVTELLASQECGLENQQQELPGVCCSKN